MENYFEKYANHILDLKKEIASLNERISGFEQKNKRSFLHGKESSLVYGYYLVTKEILAKRGIDRLLSFRGLLFFGKEIIFTIIRLPFTAIRWIYRKYKASLPARVMSSFFYQIKFYLQRTVSNFRPAREEYKIGIFIPTLSALAGAEKYSMALTQAIQENFHHVTIEVISTNIFSDRPSLYDIPTASEIFQKFQIDLTGVRFRYHVLDYHNGHQWDLNFKKVAALSKSYDLFINCQYNLYHTLSKKSLYICHFPHSPVNQLQLGKILKQQIKKLYVSSYDAFLPNSTFTEEWLTKYWPSIKDSKKLVLNPPVPMNIRQGQENWADKKNIILTCGRFEPEKKLLQLIEIFNSCSDQLEDYEFHIAGTAYLEDPSLLNYYQSMRRMAATNKKIKLHPNISFDKLTTLYGKARVYWHGMGYLEDLEKDPIRTEHFGMTVIEAMSHGCIPVVHNSGYPPSIVRGIGFDTIWNDGKDAIQKLTQLVQRQDIDTLATQAFEASKQYSTENFKLNFKKIIQKKKLIPGKFFN